jgi:hypothetical protein
VAFFSANAHLLTDKTLTFRNFVNGREVVKGTLQLGHLKRTLELEICHYEYHRRLINAKIDFHKMLAAAPFALATQTPELSVRFANYQEARAVDAMLASLLEWWLDGDVGDLKNRTLNIQVNECDQLKAVVCMEACFRQIVKVVFFVFLNRKFVFTRILRFSASCRRKREHSPPTRL